jgi:rod shape-determining protein MreC
MDLLFYRYRHLTVLLAAIVAQLGLLAFQVRNDQDVRLIRVWTVTALTPLAQLLESVRSGSADLLRDYLLLLEVRQENKRLKEALDQATLENQRLRADLELAEHASALALFQKTTPMKTVAARIIMNSTGASNSVFVDAGSSAGVRKGMAVITPGGIVGKVTAVYPHASLILILRDPLFAAGVVSQKHRVQGTLRGQGNSPPIVDFVQNEQTVEPGEWFYTSGQDFVFPRGLRVGVASVVENGLRRKKIQIRPSGFEEGLDTVLVVLEGVHAPVPEAAPEPQAVTLLAPPPEASAPASDAAAKSGPLSTDADRVVDHLRGKLRGLPVPAPEP